MARAGAFSANFDPVVLEEFRSFCMGRGERYTKVLEQLAIAYLKTKGELLSGASGVPVPSPSTSGKPQSTTNTTASDNQDLMRRVMRLEENDEFNAETFETIFKRLEEVEKKVETGRYLK
ncbi:hypothetical protein [Synechococcus sp. WH 8101]|uniref:hypothetical protein n=1 Tax=Synechococcus sp. WH 8101 TaxID=59932 RepID=UPI001023224B|nr:hypothetical protein [Synechococcus sp. WH 8101]